VPAPDKPTPLDVCLVALHALPAIRPATNRPVGGTETRAWLLARGLAAADTAVRFVVRGERAMEPFVEQGVHVLPRFDRLYSLYEAVGHCLQKQPGFPWLKLRRFEPRLLWQLPLLSAARLLGEGRGDPRAVDPLYQTIDSDLFCTFGVQANSARVIASAHAAGKPAVLMIGSDGDLDARYTPQSDYVSQYGDRASVCHWMLQQADVVVTQTPQQQQMLQDRFGRTGELLANPIDLADWDRSTSAHLPADLRGGLERYALWVGRAEPLHKRPQLLLEVARRCPEVEFLMVLNPRDAPLEQQIRSERPANVQIVTSVPYELMPALFARAGVFVSTSALEGFPNVFLQAAAAGVPIASLDVGEAFLREAAAGEHAAGDIDRLSDFVRRCWGSPSPGIGTTRRYLQEHHDLSRQVSRLRAILSDALANHRRLKLA
jgi:glycosyltransferase involved in cell wall biosynthesis